MYCETAQGCMDQAFRWVALLSQGLQSNFWGLGCPPHCQAFPLSSFLLAFLIGWLLGLLSLASFLGLLPVSSAHLPQAPQSGHSPLSRHTSDRLQLYLHERGLRGRGGR